MNEERGSGWQRWVSSRHRASRDPATGKWQIESCRLHETSNSGPITVRDYVEALPERTYLENLETFAGSPGSEMAVFELEDAGKVHVFGVRCVPLAGLPEIIAEPLTLHAEYKAIRDVFPLYREIMDATHFSWDAPTYRMACRSLGIDPDDGRPEYRREDMPLVDALIHWILNPRQASDHKRLAVSRFLDLIRSDQNPRWGLLDEVLGYLPLYRDLNVPCLDEIERRVRVI